LKESQPAVANPSPTRLITANRQGDLPSDDLDFSTDAWTIISKTMITPDEPSRPGHGLGGGYQAVRTKVLLMYSLRHTVCGWVAQLAQRLGLDLAIALPWWNQNLAQLFKGFSCAPSVEAITKGGARHAPGLSVANTPSRSSRSRFLATILLRDSQYRFPMKSPSVNPPLTNRSFQGYRQLGRFGDWKRSFSIVISMLSASPLPLGLRRTLD